jgi:hypothetical protein
MQMVVQNAATLGHPTGLPVGCWVGSNQGTLTELDTLVALLHGAERCMLRVPLVASLVDLTALCTDLAALPPARTGDGEELFGTDEM